MVIIDENISESVNNSNHVFVINNRKHPKIQKNGIEWNHVTENETRDNGSQNDDNGSKESLAESDGTTIVSLNQKHLIVENSIVLVPNAEVEKVSVEEINILGWDPFIFSISNQYFPDAGKPVNQEKQTKNQLYESKSHFERRIDLHECD